MIPTAVERESVLLAGRAAGRVRDRQTVGMKWLYPHEMLLT